MTELSPAAIEKGLEIELIGEDPVHIRGNQELTKILLSNLIRNAIQATPVSGFILVTLREHTQGPCIEIEDSGPGIPEAERQKIFERFYRLPEATAPGSGLGLSIVEAIITLHAASISFSTPERHSGLIVAIQYTTSG